jgi:GntR family transcriptional regulator
MLDSVNTHSSVSIYHQIENSVKADIASGALKPGDKLPTLKELAERLGTNFNTISKAYRDLEVLGYIQGQHGRGVFVRQDGEAKCRLDVRESVVRRMHEVLAEAKSAGIKQSDIQTLVKKCMESDAGPYEIAPKALLAMAKKV